MAQKIQRYYGRLGYADGRLVKVIGHSINEGSNGFWEEFNCLTVGTTNDYNTFSKIHLINSVEYHYHGKITVVIIRMADGKTKVGYAVCSPEDRFNPIVGQRIAVMRAFNDTDRICRYVKRLDKSDGKYDYGCQEDYEELADGNEYYEHFTEGIDY